MLKTNAMLYANLPIQPIIFLNSEPFYFYPENLVLWAKPVPHCGSQSPLALPEESLQEFEVN
jgi:hypothetical protein